MIALKKYRWPLTGALLGVLVFLAVYAQDEIAHAELGGRVQADGWLVQEQKFRLVQQRRGQLAAHALPQRKLAHRRGKERREVERVRKLF